MSGAGGILRGPDAPPAQHPLVLGTGRRFFQPGGYAGILSAQGPAAGHNRSPLRGLAPTPGTAQPRYARPAFSARAASASHVVIAAGHRLMPEERADGRHAHREILFRRAVPMNAAVEVHDADLGS